VLWALNDATGAVKWKFDTVPPSLWGDPDVNSGGGLWYPPSFDAAGNLYVDVANPAPFLGTPDDPWGSSRPGANLYTDSLVKLDSRTGKVMWYHQVLPHDIYDWDVQDSPVVTNAGGRPVVLATGKIGFVYEFDQRTGQLLWKTSVGIHNGHDNDDLLAMSGQFSKLPQLPVTLFPGALGGVPAPAAADDSTAYVAVNNLSVTWTNQEPPPVFPAFTAGKGEVVALDLVTGKIKWDVPLDQSPYGATTVVNDLVFTTTFDGTVYALNKHTGAVVWQAKLPAASNAPVAVNGDTLYAGAGWTEDSTQKAAIVAFRLRN
jgi:outer membrane protein assembly factor BamB